MDISLLSKMIGELILDHDRVALPGVGTFVAVDMPASFSDRGYTINPPYRKLSFTADKADDSLLAGLYASSNGIEIKQAKAIIGKYLRDMEEELRASKLIVFDGLGRLRATRDNTYFFVCDENLDIFPDGYALKPVSLKNHTFSVKETPEAVSAESELPAEPDVPEEPVAPAEAESEDDCCAKPDDVPHRGFFPRFLIWTAVVAVAVALLIFVLGHCAPHTLDHILYSPEELEILNYDA